MLKEISLLEARDILFLFSNLSFYIIYINVAISTNVCHNKE